MEALLEYRQTDVCVLVLAQGFLDLLLDFQQGGV